MSLLTSFDMLELINNLDHDKVLTPEAKLLMAKSLMKFNHDAIRKFIAGQKEHGGDIRERDLKQEMYKEHIDLFWYHAADTWPKSSVVGKLKILKKDRK